MPDIDSSILIVLFFLVTAVASHFFLKSLVGLPGKLPGDFPDASSSLPEGRAAFKPGAVSRRQLLPHLVKEVGVTIDALQGRESFALTDLWKLPDEKLATIIPVIIPGNRISIQEGYVCVYRIDRSGETLIPLFPMEQHKLDIFNRFNGKITLGEIARDITPEPVPQETAEPEAGAESFVVVRTLFLDLVNQHVCAPKNPIALDEQTPDD